MNYVKALKILGIDLDSSPQEIKKKYRQLMLQTHPDINGEHGYPYEASDINVAYEYLQKNDFKPEVKMASEVARTSSDSNVLKKRKVKWYAPTNENAFAPRKILHKVYGDSGEVLGTAVLDSGKFYWTKDEDFDMFLRSIYECSLDIVKSNDMEVMTEVAYLLSQQFVDRDTFANFVSTETELHEDHIVYCFDGMLEVNKRRWVLKPGEYLKPSKVANHRLFVSDGKKRELGYISFKDDRLYYGIIPVFERRAAKLEIQVTDTVKKGSGAMRYYPLRIRMILLEESSSQLAININKKIEELIKP